MRHLIDTYIRAEDSVKISAFDDFSLIQLIVERGVDALKELPAGIAGSPAAMAETIENNLRRVIIDEQPLNPKYYEKMSELLDALIQERKIQALEYAAYLQKLVELTRQVANPSGGVAYPKSLHTKARRALYDNLDRNEQLAAAVDQAILAFRQDGWRGNLIKERAVRYAIREQIPDPSNADRIYQLAKNQGDY